MPTTASTHQRHAATFLTHIFGGGLEADEHFVVERFQSTADGQIRPLDEGQVKGGRKPRTTMSRRSVRRLRPERNEIIIATDISVDGGIQYCGEWSCGLFANGRHR